MGYAEERAKMTIFELESTALIEKLNSAGIEFDGIMPDIFNLSGGTAVADFEDYNGGTTFLWLNNAEEIESTYDPPGVIRFAPRISW